MTGYVGSLRGCWPKGLRRGLKFKSELIAYLKHIEAWLKAMPLDLKRVPRSASVRTS